MFKTISNYSIFGKFGGGERLSKITDPTVVMGEQLDRAEKISNQALANLYAILQEMEKTEFTIENVREYYKSKKKTFERSRVGPQLGDVVAAGHLEKEGTPPDTIFSFPKSTTTEES